MLNKQVQITQSSNILNRFAVCFTGFQNELFVKLYEYIILGMGILQSCEVPFKI